MNSNEKSKKTGRKRYRNKGLYLTILIVLLYFISRMPPLLSASAQSTYIVEHGKIEKVIESEAYVVREEKIFTSIGNGDVKYFVTEGEKIEKGRKLAEVYLNQLDEKSIKDLESINLRLQNIKEKQDTQDLFKGDIKKLEQQISILIKSIQEDLKEQKYDKIITMKMELEDLLDKKSIIAGGKSFSGKNISQLEQQKTQLESKINSSIQTIYSNSSGFVALGSDGLEELLNYKTLHEITGEQLKMLNENKFKPPSTNIEKGQPVIRIIENYKWSIIVEIDKQQGEGIEKGQNVKIRAIDKNRELSSIVRNIVEDGDKKIVILDLNEFISEFCNVRTMTVEIITDGYEGAVVANSSIIEKDGVKGVYIVNVAGIPSFKPIKVKISNKEYSILYDGDFEQKSKNVPDEIKQIKTINLYDKVVMNGAKVKEGKRIR